MADEGFKRKLTAILNADAVEYSRLMGEDEEATVSTLTAYREVFYTLIQQHNGQVLDSPGDNLLAEFASVVDAVQCAVLVQKEIKARNNELPENRRMQFRIGINLGDVIQEKGQIYGDGVNIAARLEGLSEPGGICVSRTTYDQIKNKLAMGYEYLGEHRVKNIHEPVRVYRVLTEPEAAGKLIGEKRFLGRFSRRTALAAIIALVIVAGGLIGWNIYLQGSKRVEAASIENMAYSLPDKPSIAVLPFTNMSSDPEQDYLGDAISENIISSLAILPDLLVISSDSMFIYKDKPIKIKQVSEELGVQYVLKGSVVKSENNARITVHFIDALTGRYKWSQKYNRKLHDFLQMLDEITMKVCTELNVQLGADEGLRFWHKGTDNLEAWEFAIRAYMYLYRPTREDTKMAKDLAERAISIDPEYSYAWAVMGRAHLYDARYGFSESRTESKKKSVECINKALSLDESNYYAYMTKGNHYMQQKKIDMAIAELEKAITFAPGDPLPHRALSSAMRYACRPEDAIPHAKMALRLSPNAPWWGIYSAIGWPYYWLRQYEEAIYWFNKTLVECQNSGGHWAPHTYLSMVYSEIGQMDKARFHMQKVLEYDPKFNLESRRKSWFYKDPAYTDRAIMALRKAGAPEHPPSQ